MSNIFIRRKTLKEILDHCYACAELLNEQQTKLEDMEKQIKKLNTIINTQKLTKTDKSIEELIESYQECNSKGRCNLFNSSSSIKCDKILACSVIKYYEDMLNNVPMERPPNRVVKKVKIKVKKPNAPSLEGVHEFK